MTPIDRPDKDVLVLGAGIIGVCVALHLQKRGKSVLLVDRRAPGEETSYGNAGLIERASVIPYGFPREIPTLLKYATNRSADVRFRWTFLPKLLPWIARFWFESSSRRLRRAAMDMLPLIERSVTEHTDLMAEAGILHRARRTGWMEAYRTEKAFSAAKVAARALDEFGIRYDFLGPKDLQAREPHLAGSFAGAVHWLDPATVADPGGLVKDYADLFVRKGGEIVEAGASAPMAARCGPARPSWRSAPGRMRSTAGSAIGCRSLSSAVTMCISSRRVMPCSITPSSMSSAATCWRR
jgi:D-amino-acid dehydrogenase